MIPTANNEWGPQYPGHMVGEEVGGNINRQLLHVPGEDVNMLLYSTLSEIFIFIMCVTYKSKKVKRAESTIHAVFRKILREKKAKLALGIAYKKRMLNYFKVARMTSP